MLAAVVVREDGTAVIGGGARLIDVYAALAAAGRAVPAGSCPSVGLAGLLLGGGIGVLARAYGLTCDRLVAATVVTGAGSQVETSAEREPELFWALCGGGGGTAGVVTEFVLRTEPAPELIVFELCFPPGSVAARCAATATSTSTRTTTCPKNANAYTSRATPTTTSHRRHERHSRRAAPKSLREAIT